MNYDRILIRYGEISTKGRNRHKFVEKLRKSVKIALVPFPNIKIEASRDRMYVLLNGESGIEIIGKLKHIFGIQSFSPAIKVERNVEALKNSALDFVRSHYKEGQTFKVTPKRSDKTFELNTDGINRTIGGYLLQNIPGLRVDVKNPDINLRIEVRENAIYLSCETIPGAGGMPSGSNGRAMLMLSGGIDSPVAGYLAMKRGLEIEAIHFHSPPFTSERSKEKVVDLTKKLAEIYGSNIKLHIVPFTSVQQAVREQIPENYSMTSTRRMMLRIADEIRIKQEGLAIITGESLGQVASQTLESMFTINEVTNTPILRPLIMMDKTDIIKIAHEIDTLEISNRPFEDCCTIFVPASPKTKPRREKVQHYESYFDFTPLINEAVQQVETLVIQPEEQNSEFNSLF
ncbi:tRNA 4-thiouridine(8) synthase ThiI [Bacillus sp. AFS076308]|uniref:tRNA uracil 4-sulfurtransferase ThiI n=1 Tax=unclassified Bacillus (in: firmicutes) TaxID=185979 RepID=UPI000BF3BB9B|nr:MULTISPECIES: tRNA uracil 4-sulfurtransferase ThiI [unclassified Bacillus (in: firmicutes)]PFN96489.1 tRNA 4-thiouridine(8) synthase ThiI [Bacillus sp. AFS076308]PGV46662.1 tRNA 4-thiouridine(8) synthase ThiI [Bacillus sp. AFS037270]